MDLNKEAELRTMDGQIRDHFISILEGENDTQVVGKACEQKSGWEPLRELKYERVETQSENEHTEWITLLRARATVDDLFSERKSRIGREEIMNEKRKATGVRASRLENGGSFNHIKRVPGIETEQQQRFTIVSDHILADSVSSGFPANSGPGRNLIRLQVSSKMGFNDSAPHNYKIYKTPKNTAYCNKPKGVTRLQSTE